jgi:FkbM family methyltransferase
MIPRRFATLRPYLASFIHPRFQRPPAGEVLHWFTQPSKERRAARFIAKHSEAGGFREIRFHGYPQPFYYPQTANWSDLCQTIDECFNPANWHHFLAQPTPVGPDDVVVDCGAAEGLFSFAVAGRVKRVFAIEPVPFWRPAMARTIGQFDNVELLQVGVGHKRSLMRMTDDEVQSHISAQGCLEVPITTLDALFAERDIAVSFIKADVEGFEFQMLLGAEELIRRNRPKISLTVYHDENHHVEMAAFLREIHGDYRFRTRGIAANGNPILLQAY